MPRSGLVYQLRASAQKILSTVYAIERRTKLIGGMLRAGDPFDGTKLALLLSEAKLRNCFISQRRLTKTGDGHSRTAPIHNQFQLRHRARVAELLPQPRLSEA